MLDRVNGAGYESWGAIALHPVHSSTMTNKHHDKSVEQRLPM
ncbi:hypothetical protein [Oculatella sp. LEGE 06141]|nr:hypothetical protein [Oculatella sp. LEGE 06141]